MDLKRMSKTALSTYLKKLNCSAGGIYQFSFKENAPAGFQPIYTIPRNFDRHPAYRQDLDYSFAKFLNDDTNFSGSAPIICDTEQGITLTTLSLPGFGILVLGRSGGHFDDYILNSIQQMNIKLANACNTCVQNESRIKSETKYRNIFESIQDVYAEIDVVSGKILEISPSIFEVSGFTRDELLGRDISRFFENVPDRSVLMDTIKVEGRIDDYQITLINKNNEDRIVSFTASIKEGKLGGSPLITGTMRDITKRIRSERELRENEHRLKTIINSIPVGIVISNPDTRIVTLANPAGAEMIGVSAKKMIGLNGCDILCELNSGSCKIDHHKERHVTNLMLKRPDGINVPIMKTMVPVHILGQEYIMESFVDISVHIEAEEALKTNIRTKDNFVSNVSHELRTPLASILGFSGTILKDDQMADETRRKFTRIIFEESQRLTRLIENVLNIARMDAGKTQFEMQPVQLDPIIQEVVEAQNVMALKKQIELKTQIENDLPLITASTDAIKQMATNLISNAIKFTDNAGKIEVRLFAEKENIILSVRDNGLGIPEEAQEKIFEKFYRVERPQREDPGTGIGLAIVKDLVSQHNGQIVVQSTPGKGTMFTVTLPVDAANEEA